jgi:hypothetical protein
VANRSLAGLARTAVNAIPDPMRRKILCKNGNTVERFYDRATRSSVTIVHDANGNQVADAEYDGDKASADFSMRMAIKDNGGEIDQ